MTSLGCFIIAFLLGVSIVQLFQMPNSGIRLRPAWTDPFGFSIIYLNYATPAGGSFLWGKTLP